MKLGRKLAVGVVEEAERIPRSEATSEVMRDDVGDGVGVPLQGKTGARKPPEERPCREEFASSTGNAVDA
jgi:hypothetical protein